MEEKLFAGFARVDITPKEGGMPLAGYGSTERRLGSRVLAPLFINAVALSDEKETCLFLTLDIINTGEKLVRALREAIEKRTGAAGSRVFIGATHTHSAPDQYSSLPNLRRWADEFLPERAAEAAARALADLKPARFSIGSGEAGRDGFRLNFCRYYYMTEIEKKHSYTPADLYPVGDNFGTQYARDKKRYCYVGHEEEADHSIQIFRFERDAADDIVLFNFAAHATITGGLMKTDLSPDFPGMTVQAIERLCPGVKASFLQGCAGNINANTRMQEDGARGITFGADRDVNAYSASLAAYVKVILETGMTPAKGAPLAFERRIHTARLDHSMDQMALDGADILERYEKEGYTQEIKDLCIDRGYNSIYQLSAAKRKAAKGETDSMELNAVRIGDCALVTAPFELFSQTGLHIKEKSPFKMTFVKSYSCGYQSYLPSKNSTPNSYESNTAHYVRGTAEELETLFAEMLQNLK